MLNHITLMGRLTAVPELKSTAQGTPVLSATLAVERPGYKEKTTDFLPIVAWRGTAEMISKYFHKGSMICIEGMLTTRKWDTKEGEHRTSYEIVVDRVHFTGERRSDAPTAPDDADEPPVYGAPQAYASTGERAARKASEADAFSAVEDDGDLPF